MVGCNLQTNPKRHGSIRAPNRRPLLHIPPIPPCSIRTRWNINRLALRHVDQAARNHHQQPCRDDKVHNRVKGLLSCIRLLVIVVEHDLVVAVALAVEEMNMVHAERDEGFEAREAERDQPDCGEKAVFDNAVGEEQGEAEECRGKAEILDFEVAEWMVMVVGLGMHFELV